MGPADSVQVPGYIGAIDAGVAQRPAFPGAFERPGLHPVASVDALRAALAQSVIPAPWLHFDQAEQISPHILYHALNGKGPSRVLMRGGPLVVPDHVLFRRDDDIFAKCSQAFRDRAEFRKQKLGSLLDLATEPKAVSDQSCPKIFSQADDWANFRDVARQIAREEMALPLVYKPNAGNLGKGIFFINRVNDATVRFTFSSLSEFEFSLVNFFAYRGISAARSREQSVVEVNLDLSKHSLENILFELWSHLSIGTSSAPCYDSGIMEELIPLVTVGGKAYETRIYADVDLSLSQERTAIVRPDSYSKIGASALFSNRSGRANAKSFGFNEMYTPLVEEGIIADGDSFRKYVEHMIEAAAIYFVRRLQAAGIHFAPFPSGKRLGMQFDLGWQSHAKNQGALVPALIEIGLNQGYENFLRACQFSS